jgi:hypothetical protein
MILNDSGGGKATKKVGGLTFKTKKSKGKKRDGTSAFKKVIKWLKKDQSEMFGGGKKKKSSDSKKHKSKSIMETTTAKKNAEKEIAKSAGKTVKNETKISNSKTTKPSSLSKKSTSKSSKPTSSHKSTVTHSTSSKKTEAVKRVAGKSSKKETPKKTTTTSSKKKTPSKASQIKEQYKKSADAYYNNQKSLLDAQKIGDLVDINNAYDQNVEAENKNTRDVSNQYDDRLGEINTDAYRQSQLTQLGAQDAGIQNSQQLLGLQAGDVYRTSNMKQGASTERDRLLADINGRISTLQKQKLNDVNKVNSQYNSNLRGARATADGMYYDKSSGFDADNYTQDRQHAWDVENRDANFAHDREMEDIQYNHNRSLSRQSTGGSKVSAVQRAGTTGSGGLANQANQYKQTKQTSAVSQYNNSFANKNQSVVVRNKYPLGAPPTVASNPNLTAWQKMKMIGG